MFEQTFTLGASTQCWSLLGGLGEMGRGARRISQVQILGYRQLPKKELLHYVTGTGWLSVRLHHVHVHESRRMPS